MVWFRHKKTGKDYRVLTQGARMQCSGAREVEDKFKDTSWTIYGNEQGWFMRPTEEFNEKFELVYRGD